MRRLLLAFLLFVSTLPAAADVIKVDKHSDQLTSIQYYVLFLSRPIQAKRSDPSPGHAFVAWVQEDSNGVIQQDAFGYYPIKGIGLLRWVPGHIVDEDVKHSLSRATTALAVRVDKKTFDDTRDVLGQWKNKANNGFKLIQKDCVTFADTIAKQIGLKVPRDRSDTPLPTAYIDTLVRLNVPLGQARKSTTPASENVLTGDNVIKYVSPEALKQIYASLAQAEDFPEIHFDIIVHVDGDTLNSVSVVKTRMRRDPGYPRGMSACIYEDMSGTSIPDSDLTRAVKTILQLPRTQKDAISDAIKINISNPSLGEPAAWGVAETSQPPCYLGLWGPSLFLRMPNEQGSTHYSAMFIRGKFVQYPSDFQSVASNQPIEINPVHPYKDFAPFEEKWLQYADIVHQAVSIYNTRASALFGESQTNKRKAFSMDVTAASDAKFILRGEDRNVAANWYFRHAAAIDRFGETTATQFQKQNSVVFRDAAAQTADIAMLTGFDDGTGRALHQMDGMLNDSRAFRLFSKAEAVSFSFAPDNTSRQLGDNEHPGDIPTIHGFCDDSTMCVGAFTYEQYRRLRSTLYQGVRILPLE